MRKLTIEALQCGAFGFTTSRTDSHKTPDGELVPSRVADDQELLGIGSALGVTGTGAFGMNSDFDDEEFELRWMRGSRRKPAARSGSCSPTVTRTRALAAAAQGRA